MTANYGMIERLLSRVRVGLVPLERRVFRCQVHEREVSEVEYDLAEIEPLLVDVVVGQRLDVSFIDLVYRKHLAEEVLHARQDQTVHRVKDLIVCHVPSPCLVDAETTRLEYGRSVLGGGLS